MSRRSLNAPLASVLPTQGTIFSSFSFVFSLLQVVSFFFGTLQVVFFFFYWGPFQSRAMCVCVSVCVCVCVCVVCVCVCLCLRAVGSVKSNAVVPSMFQHT